MQNTFTSPTAHSSGVNTLRVPPKALRTVDACPHILEVNLVVVLRGDLDTAGVVGVVLEGLFAAKAPLLEACAVGIVAYPRDERVSQVAVFVRQRIDQTVFTVDDAFGELDASLVLVFCWAITITAAAAAAAGMCSFGCSTAGCCLQSLAPDDFHAAGLFSHFLDLAAGDGVVQQFVE